MSVFADYAISSERQWILDKYNSRMLSRDSELEDEGVEVELLKVRVLPSEANEANDLSFKWNVTSFTEGQL